MAQRTALEVIQDAALEMGLAAPPAAAASTDLTAQQLLAVYNATGEMLVRRRSWQALFSEGTIATQVGVTAYAVPADFNRPLSQTEWDRLQRFRLQGPATDQQWQWAKSSGISTASTPPLFKLIGGQINLSVTPTDIRTLAYNYVSKYWCRDAGGQPKLKATLDNDYAVFDDRLMVAGVKLRFFQAKGFDTTSYAADFQVALDDAMAQDGGGQVLNMAGGPGLRLLSVANVPENSWPL